MVREIAIGLVLSVIPQWIATACAQDAATPGEQPKRVWVQAVGNASDGNVVVTSPSGDGQVKAFTFVSADGEGQDGTLKKEVRVIAVPNPSIDDKDDAERGWLGISLGNVPAALRAQLNTDDKGILVLNVVKDSPADRAGLQVHDVLLSINNQELDGYQNAVDAIRSRKPGESVTLRVLRDGQEQTLRATLISRADQAATGFNWKFETPQSTDIEDQVNTRGHMIFRGPKGEWTMKNLGDLSELHGLPANVLKMIPKTGTRTIQIQRDGDEQTVRVQVQRDGGTIVVHQAGDEIAVERVDQNGNKTNATYGSEDELKAADEEAYALLHGAASGTVHLNVDGDEGDGDFDFDFDFDADAFHGDMQEFHAQLEESMETAREAYESAMQEMQRLSEDLQKQGLGDGSLGSNNARTPRAFFHNFRFGKPNHSFETAADGTIRVKIRKGDSELTRVFQNESDLQRRDPALFSKYRELMDAEK